jgi:amino acid transporter
MLYGASLMLEFVTLVVLRIKEPGLQRAFRVPGGLPGAVLTGVCPLLLLLLAVMESDHETVLGINGLLFGALIMLAGVAVYVVSGKLKILRAKPVVPEKFEDLETV